MELINFSFCRYGACLLNIKSTIEKVSRYVNKYFKSLSLYGLTLPKIISVLQKLKF